MNDNQYRISEIFRQRAGLSFVSSLAFVGATFWYWSLPQWIEPEAISAAAMVTIFLSFSLGRTARQLGIGIGRAAFGVSWRIGCIWVVLAAIVESIVSSNHDAATTVIRFPFLFVPTVVISEIAMLLGYASRSTEDLSLNFGTIWTFFRRELVPTLGLVVACVTLFWQFQSNEGQSALPKPNAQETSEAEA